MGLHLKIAGLLLLVQVFHLASFENATDSPGKTIDKSWLRERVRNKTGSQNAVNTKEELDTGSAAGGDSSTEYSGGIASGSMAIYNEGEDYGTSGDQRVNETSLKQTADTATVPPTSPTTKKTKSPDTTVSLTNATSNHTNSPQIQNTEAKKEHHNSTSHLSPRNSTSSSDLLKTTSAPGRNATQESTTKPNKDAGSTIATQSTSKTTATTATTQEKSETSTTSSSTTVSPSETSGTSPSTTTMAAPITTEKANKTTKEAAVGSNSERGLASDNRNGKRNGAWGGVLGTAVAVACVGVVAYIILKKKHQKGFSHRKLVEDFPSNTVHRLDNGAPLDLNFGVSGLAYYNPGLQGDNIQMGNIPGRR